MFGRLDTLRAIEARDPDGWTTRQPTSRDYHAFRLWVLDNFSREILADYLAGGWEPRND